MKKHNSIISEYLQKYPEFSFRKLAEKILSENNIDRSVESMRKNISEFTKGKQIVSKDSNKAVGDEKKSEFSDNTATFEYKGRESITSLNQAIKFFEIDTKLWDIDRWVSNSWDVTNAEGITYTNYQVKVFLKKKSIQTDISLFIDNIAKQLINASPKFPTINYNISNTSKLLEIGIHDFHFGKLAWKDEVGVDYDIKIAEQLYDNTVDVLIQRTSHYQYEKILFIVGSDFFNVDNPANTTFKGTPQDEDTRWQKTFVKGYEIARNNALKLSQIAPIEIIIFPGNHDETKAFYLGETLRAYFHNNKNIKVDNRPLRRKYIKYGNCGIGFAHGDKIPDKDWGSIFAAEEPELWGSTKYREIHAGDKHHLVKKPNSVKVNNGNEVLEHRGCVFRITRSISSIDAWHNSAGYIGSIRGTEAFVWDKEAGIIDIINANQ